jgi:hypothetical protein
MISSDTSARADAGKPVSDRRRRRWWLTPLVIALVAAPVWLFAAAIRRSITNGAAVKCASNLRNIGVAIREYAGVHDGNYPDNLGTLYLHSTAEAQNPAMYVCQGTDQRSARGTSPDVVARNIVHGHVSYQYVGGGLRFDADADVVLALDLPPNHDRFVVVLFADGTVDYFSQEQARPLVAQAIAGVRPVRRSATAPNMLE